MFLTSRPVSGPAESGRRTARLWCLTALIAACQFGCSSPETPPPDGSADAGSESADVAEASNDNLTVSAVLFVSGGQPRAVSAGDVIDLWRPPQGGHVLLIGARIQGLDSDTIELRAKLLRSATQEILAEESRTVKVTPDPDDPATSETSRDDVSGVAHIPVCPVYDEPGVDGATQQLVVEVTELYADFSTGTATLEVTPTCVQTAQDELALCQCECGGSYVLGGCPTDPNN